MATEEAERGNRIPFPLQNIFLASNRGETVDKPPPNRLANRWFRGLANIMRRKPKRKEGEPVDQTFSTEAEDSGPDSPGTSVGKVDETEPLVKKKTPRKAIKLTPQSYLDAMLKARGYSIEHYDALQTGYHNRPTRFQIASYDAYVVNLIKQGDMKTFSSLLQAGLSSNPCNVFGDSILHTICRMSQHPKLLQLMLSNGADLHISDDYGKTILHDACWAATPNFSLVALLLDHDPYLLHMRDARGALPLSYIQDRHVEAWLEFLQDHKDQFWPEDTKPKPPKYALQPPNQRPVPDPGLSLQMVRMLAAGKMSPRELEFLLADAESDSYCSSDEYSDEEEDDDDASEESDDDARSQYEDDSTLCSDECEGLPEKKKDLVFDSAPPEDGLESEDSVVEGFEDELSKDSDLEGFLGIQCPRYAATQNVTSFVAPPVSAPAFKEPKVPEMLEIIISSDTSASQETEACDSPTSLTAKKVPIIEPEMTPEVKKENSEAVTMVRESVLL